MKQEETSFVKKQEKKKFAERMKMLCKQIAKSMMLGVRLFIQLRFHTADYIADSKAVFLDNGFSWCRSAKFINCNHVTIKTSVTLPAK